MEDILKYIDIIILLIITLFLFFLFKKLLGKEVGFQREEGQNQDRNPFKKQEANLSTSNLYSSNSIKLKLSKISSLDNSFYEKKFIDSAKKAYEMILKSFLKGSIKDISDFINTSVAESFEQHIINRDLSNKSITIDRVNFLDTEIVDVDINGSKAEIGVKFTVRYNQYQASEIKQKNQTTIWSFSKDLSSNSSIWKLVKINNIY